VARQAVVASGLAQGLANGEPVWLVDSLPIEACKFARATFCRRFQGEADYGYDYGIKRTFYGFRLHLRASRDGVIVGYELAPARVNDRAVLAEMDLPAGSVGIGDRGYWNPELRARLEARGVRLLTPFLHKSKDPEPARSARLSAVRYRLESTNGQLAVRYHAKRTWARDWWHLCHRLVRKILSHTVLACVTTRAGWSPLSFDKLLAA
jgi:hypothetical protein